MNENRMKDMLESIARRGVPNVNLWSRIVKRVENRSFMQTMRTRPALALLLVLLALVLLSGVAYAFGKVAGYIPGVGIVDQSVPLRTLREAVVLERDGITVGVYQVVANAEYTFVGYALYGRLPMPKEGFPLCGAFPSLQLPDGSRLEILGGGAGGYGGEAGESIRFETTVYYPPIPANVDQVIFALDCVLPEGTGPENWQLPFVLIPAPEGFATPAIEVGATFVAGGPTFDVPPTPTLEPELTPFQYDPSFPNTPTPVPNGSGLYLERVIELPNSYILVGNFADAGDLPGYVLVTDSAYDYLPRIEDAEGNPVEFKVRNDIKPVVNWGNTYYWAYEIEKPVKGSLKITLDEIDINTSDTIRFDFDTGPHPQPGQTWQLDLPIHLRKYDYVVDSVEMIDHGYRFNFHSSKDVPAGTSFMLDIPGSSLERGPSSAVEDHRGKTMVKYSEEIIYLISPPTGQLTVELTLFETIPLQGPWTLTWMPPGQ
jgi:hypothetical protein